MGKGIVLPSEIADASQTTLRVRVRWRGEIVLSGERAHIRAAEQQLRAAQPITGEHLRALSLDCEPDQTHPEAIELAKRLGLPADTPWEECLRHVDTLHYPHRALAEQIGESPDMPLEELIAHIVQERKRLRELIESMPENKQ